MLQLTFVFPGIVICIDSSLSSDQRIHQYADIEQYFKIFTNEDNPKKVIVAITKIDLISSEELFEINHEIDSLNFLKTYVKISVSSKNEREMKQQFIDVFEELFYESLISFDFTSIHPRYMNKLFDVSRVEDHGWNKDGTAYMSGMGIKSQIAPILGEIKNANG